MSLYVVRLPGGGRIKKTNKEQIIPWWDYRSFYIDTSFYKNLKKIIKLNSNNRFVFVSGGVGAFIYQNFVSELDLSTSLERKIARDIISCLNQVLIDFIDDVDTSVYKEEVAIKNLAEQLEKSDKKCFFLKPEDSFMSTDDLAASAAFHVSSDLLIYIKEGAPEYHIGFPCKTKIEHWNINDIEIRASNLKEENGDNYILDLEAIGKIKRHKIPTIISSPEKLESFFDLDFEQCKSMVTKIVF